MLNTFEVNKVLIIAPLRVARDTWPAEIEKWDHLKNLDISIVVGDVKTRIAAVHHPAMIYVVNRENVKWLVEYYEKNGMRWDFSMVVIDELSSFKNYQSQRFKFLRKVRPYVKRWVGLTGTPSSNGLMDLWSEIGILDGGERLGKFIGRYREAYFKAASMNPSSGVVFQYKPKEGAEELIYQRISDITISMKALDYLNMPDCIPTRYEVEMNADERKLYNMLKQDLLIPLKDGDIDAANAASLTGKLLQMSNGAVYDENGKARILHDHKLEALEDLIEAANGEVKAMVEEMGLPYAYDHFAEGESPDPPFICFLYPKAANFSADGIVYHHFNRLAIEVYTDYKDPDTEAAIEEVLTAHELFYEKSEAWIETEKMYEVLYELTV